MKIELGGKEYTIERVGSFSVELTGPRRGTYVATQNIHTKRWNLMAHRGRGLDLGWFQAEDNAKLNALVQERNR